MAGASTNAPLILSIFGFYVFLGIIFGMIGQGIQSTAIGAPPEPSTLGFLGQIGYFFSGVGYTIDALPAWANAMLFLPLGITLVYIILSYLRGSS